MHRLAEPGLGLSLRLGELCGGVRLETAAVAAGRGRELRPPRADGEQVGSRHSTSR